MAATGLTTFYFQSNKSCERHDPEIQVKGYVPMEYELVCKKCGKNLTDKTK